MEAIPDKVLESDVERLTRAKLEAERDKFEAEAAKLRAEAINLQKSFLQTHQFWLALIPFAVAIVTVVIPIKNGWFDLKQQEVKNANLVLDAENKLLLAKRETITAENARLATERTVLNQNIRDQDKEWSLKKIEYTALTNQIVVLQRARDERENLLANLKEQLNGLADQNEQLKPLVTRVDELEEENLSLQHELNRKMTVAPFSDRTLPSYWDLRHEYVSEKVGETNSRMIREILLKPGQDAEVRMGFDDTDPTEPTNARADEDLDSTNDPNSSVTGRIGREPRKPRAARGPRGPRGGRFQGTNDFTSP